MSKKYDPAYKLEVCKSIDSGHATVAELNPLRGDLNAATGGGRKLSGCTAVPTELHGWAFAPILPQPLRGSGYGELSVSLCACASSDTLAGAIYNTLYFFFLPLHLRCISYRKNCLPYKVNSHYLTLLNSAYRAMQKTPYHIM